MLIRWSARIISIIASIIFIIVMAVSIINDYQEQGSYNFTADTILLFIPFLVTLTGTIIAWWREKTGGWILISGYVCWIIFPFIFMAVHQGQGLTLAFVLAMAAIPFLIAGILFLISAKSSSKPTT
jgi:hypothetical protein